eukprot:gene12860-biopygen5235
MRRGRTSWILGSRGPGQDPEIRKYESKEHNLAELRGAPRRSSAAELRGAILKMLRRGGPPRSSAEVRRESSSAGPPRESSAAELRCGACVLVLREHGEGPIARGENARIPCVDEDDAEDNHSHGCNGSGFPFFWFELDSVSTVWF